MKAILALDAGTTNVKAILVDQQANVLARSSIPLSIDYPQSGWVEQSAEAIWDAAQKVLAGCLAQGVEQEVVGLGISNQRETLVAWNRETGEPWPPASSGSAGAVPQSVRRCARRAWKSRFV